MAVDSDSNAAGQHIDKQRRYDRGIRVWGAHGQENLEKSRICLMNAGPTGSEALKNLVLGGIQSFTIVDNNKVTAADLGNNYLVTAAGLDTPRAQCVTECLKELNENVSGGYVEEDPAALIASNPQFIQQFDLVIATQLADGDAAILDALCRENNVQLLLARSYGLVGFVRTCVKEHSVIESKPDSKVDDLRLSNPWAELLTHCRSVDLAEVDDALHSHIPWGVLLVKAGQLWRAQHDNDLPRSAADRAAFKDLLRSWQRTIDGIPIPEENFGEAVANAHRLWAPPSIPSELKSILSDEAATSITASSSDFWIMVAALNRFMAVHENQLPLEGALPDMHATTLEYLKLQRLYKEKAEADAAQVEDHVKAILESIGRPRSSISSTDIRHFCRHSRYLRVVRSTPLTATDPTTKGDALRAALTAEDSAANATLWVVLRAADRFYSINGRYPGTLDGELDEDIAVLKQMSGAILAESGASSAAVSDDLVVEMCRCGAGEMHAVAAAVGAMASQEAIKLITKQFVPLQGTLIFNAMHCTSSVFDF